MPFTSHNIYAMVLVACIICYLSFFSRKFFIYDSYVVRSFLAILIVLLTYFNTWLGIAAVLASIAIFTVNEPFTGMYANELFAEQNSLQKKVYYVPKPKHAPVPQNDTDYIPLNPMQSKAGAIQPSQPATLESELQEKHEKYKGKGNNYKNVVRVQELVRPKDSKSLPIQTGLNKDYMPDPNWPDGHAFKNPYSAAQS